eukprot:235877_1
MTTFIKDNYCYVLLVVAYQFQNLVATTNFSDWHTSTTSLGNARYYIGAASYDDTIYLLGGSDPNAIFINTIDEFSISSQTFLPIASANKALE